MKKTNLLVAMMAVLVLGGCAPKPKPSNFHEFANNEKGAGLLVEYITDTKNPLKDRVKAMLALMARKWDMEVLNALDKSRDKGELAEAVEARIVPIYAKLCKDSNPNLDDLSYTATRCFGPWNMCLPPNGPLFSSRLPKRFSANSA